MRTKLIVYGHEYCADAIYLQGFLNRNAITYEWRDIEKGDPRFKDELRSLARGYLSVPTVIFLMERCWWSRIPKRSLPG